MHRALYFMHRALHFRHRSAGVIRVPLTSVHENYSDMWHRVHWVFGWRDNSKAGYYPADGSTSSSETTVTHSDYPECGISKVIHNVTNYQSSRRRIPEDNLQISTPSSISCAVYHYYKTHVIFPLHVVLVHEPKGNPFTFPQGCRRADGPTDTSRISRKK